MAAQRESFQGRSREIAWVDPASSPNENKISDGYREQAQIEVEVF